MKNVPAHPKRNKKTPQCYCCEAAATVMWQLGSETIYACAAHEARRTAVSWMGAERDLATR